MQLFKVMIWQSFKSSMTVNDVKRHFSFPAFIIAYLIYCWGEAEHERLQRKQPGQFDHET